MRGCVMFGMGRGRGAGDGVSQAAPAAVCSGVQRRAVPCAAPFQHEVAHARAPPAGLQKADIWSCGVLLYILVTGLYPFRWTEGCYCHCLGPKFGPERVCSQPPPHPSPGLPHPPTRCAMLAPNPPTHTPQAPRRRRAQAQPEAQRHAAAHPQGRLLPGLHQ